MWHLLFSGAFERFPRLKFVVTEAAAYWAADMMWKWDQYLGGGHTTKKMAALMKGKICEAAVGLLRHEHLHRRVDDVEGGDPPPPHHRLRRRDVGHGLPASRGHLAEHHGAAAGRTSPTCPSRTPASSWARPRPPATASTSTSWRPIAERIGPTPEDLGQDPTLRTDPAEVEAARWWKAEYDVKAPV